MTSGLILGVLTGLTYGLLAVGIVLIFKANRFINLAHAQLGALSALLLARLVLDNGWSWWISFPVVVALGVVTALAVERFVVRPMVKRKRHSTSLLLVTVGVSQLLLALTYVKGLAPDLTKINREGYPVPFDARIDLGSFVMRGEHVLILVLVPVAVAGLAAFLRFTVWGKAIRASASNPDAARLCGIPVARAGAVAWGSPVVSVRSPQSFRRRARAPSTPPLSVRPSCCGRSAPRPSVASRAFPSPSLGDWS